jgi:hypothetical protein
MSFLASPAFENTISTTTEKMLNFLPFHHRESSLSFSEYLFNSEFLPIAEVGISTQDLSLAIEDGTTLYSLSSVGLLFAGYFVFQSLDDSTYQVEAESSRRNISQAVISTFNRIQRSFHSCKDDSRSILYCLEILSVGAKLFEFIFLAQFFRKLDDQLILCYRNSWQLFQSSYVTIFR